VKEDATADDDASDPIRRRVDFTEALARVVIDWRAFAMAGSMTPPGAFGSRK